MLRISCLQQTTVPVERKLLHCLRLRMNLNSQILVQKSQRTMIGKKRFKGSPGCYGTAKPKLVNCATINDQHICFSVVLCCLSFTFLPHSTTLLFFINTLFYKHHFYKYRKLRFAKKLSIRRASRGSNIFAPFVEFV